MGAVSHKQNLVAYVKLKQYVNTLYLSDNYAITAEALKNIMRLMRKEKPEHDQNLCVEF